ncbi:MAG: hypothetical protein GY829_06135 [Gammaproteobacteria bacterium]|nr:hypothetical protein [Gammaproteobacteria bacterium]
MKQFILLILIFILTPHTWSAEIKVTDSSTNQVQLISDAKQINRFNFFWSQKQPVRKQQTYQWRFQLTIDSPSGKSSWVYDPRGYAREITMQQSSVIYQLSPVRSFNHFLIKDS